MSSERRSDYLLCRIPNPEKKEDSVGKEYPKPKAKGNPAGKMENHGLMYHKRKTLGYKYRYSSFMRKKNITENSERREDIIERRKTQ